MIETAVASLATMKKIFDGYMDSRDDKITEEALEPLNEEIHKLELAVREAQVDMLKIQQENQRLKGLIEQNNNWEQEKAKYEPHYFPTGQFAYVLTALKDTEYAPVHFCASCMDNDSTIQQLRKSKSGESVFCQRCNTGFETGHKHDFEFEKLGHEMSY